MYCVSLGWSRSKHILPRGELWAYSSNKSSNQQYNCYPSLTLGIIILPAENPIDYDQFPERFSKPMRRSTSSLNSRGDDSWIIALWVLLWRCSSRCFAAIHYVSFFHSEIVHWIPWELTVSRDARQCYSLALQHAAAQPAHPIMHPNQGTIVQMFCCY